MKKIINFKLYDENTAIKIAECSKTDLLDNIVEFKDSLYKTKKWNYFICGFWYNVLKEFWRLEEYIKVMEIPEVFEWYEEKQEFFNEKEKGKFLKEFNGMIIEG